MVDQGRALCSRKWAPREHWRARTALSISILALSVFGYALTGNGADAINCSDATSSDIAASVTTESLIKNVIILIGENRGLDRTFGVYKPDEKGQTISNILSKGIVNEDGDPGPNYGLAMQYALLRQSLYYIGPPNQRQDPYNTTTNLMPQPKNSDLQIRSASFCETLRDAQTEYP